MPHVQSYAFAIDAECLQFLIKKGLFNKSFDKLLDVIIHQEIGMSTLVLQNGWNISSFVKEYETRPYATLTDTFNHRADCKGGDIVYSGDLCFGRDIHPYEVMFLKTSREVATKELHSLTQAFSQ